MFDVDGTLVQSCEVDNAFYVSAVKDVTGKLLDDDWSKYPNATDRGILMTFIERQAPWLNLNALEFQVKSVYIQKINEYLEHSRFQEVPGAIEFIERLEAHNETTISLATGGWKETALLKLTSAGFDTRTLTISSANEHHSRSKIMKIAAKKVDDTESLPITYFGDAEWDVKACRKLDVNLVIIGNRTQHYQRLSDFKKYDAAFDFIVGLN